MAIGEVPGEANGLLVAAADLSAKQFYCVKVNSSSKVALCATAGEKVYGVLQNKPVTNAEANVMTTGITKAVAGAAITAGANVMTSAAGKVITAESTVLTVAATLDFASINANTTSELTAAMTGAAVGDKVYASAPAALESGLILMGYVATADVVTFRLGNVTTGAVNPASGSFGASIVRTRYTAGVALDAASNDGDIISVDLNARAANV